jgi:hypothetical protein
VGALVDKVLQGWHNEQVVEIPFATQPDFPLTSFFVPPEIDQWIKKGPEEYALVISGPPKKGKTELACAAAACVSELVCRKLALKGVAGYHFLNELDDIKNVKLKTGQALVVDECSLAETGKNVSKAWMDLKKHRRIKCRNVSGSIPQGTPRIFITNDPWHQFVSQEALKNSYDEQALKRRCVFYLVESDMRRPLPDASQHQEGPQPDRRRITRAVEPASDDKPVALLLRPRIQAESDHDNSPLVPRAVFNDTEDENPFGHPCNMDMDE